LVEPAGMIQLTVGVTTPANTVRVVVDGPPLLGKTNESTILTATFRVFSAAQEIVLPRVVLPPGCKKVETTSP
jgi:hypothetical protein